MRVIEFKILQNYDGQTVKHVLYENGVSRRLLILLKNTKDGITFNNEHIRVVDRVFVGGTLRIHIPEDEKPALSFLTSVPVLYFDKDVIALNKPPFMPVHPARQHQENTLANGFATILKENNLSAAFRAINRLDRDTSGIVISALNPYSAAKLTGTIEKEYTAICCGELHGQGTIDLPIRRKEGRGIMREVGEGGDRAVTNWEAVETKNGFTLLHIKLETGRTHQIRVHFSHLGYPLVGDTFYGTEDEIIKRQALHCKKVTFPHPLNGEVLTIDSPLPDDMTNFLLAKVFSSI